METEAALALSMYLDGDSLGAHALLEAASARMIEHDRPALRQWIWYVTYRTAQPSIALDALQQAQAAMHAAALALPPDARERFLDQVPLNRAVRTALAARCQRIQVPLVRADVPLGRPLTSSDYVVVEWTLEAPDDAAIGRPAARRKYVLRRLLAEALAQGAAPSDSDLALALGVSTRTIERDMIQLRSAGFTAPTRRRRD